MLLVGSGTTSPGYPPALGNAKLHIGDTILRTTNDARRFFYIEFQAARYSSSGFRFALDGRLTGEDERTPDAASNA